VNWLISKLVKQCIISSLVCSLGSVLLCRQVNSVAAATARSTAASEHKYLFHTTTPAIRQSLLSWSMFLVIL